MSKFTKDPKKNAHILREISRREENLVRKARDLASKLDQVFEREEKKPLSDKEHKERQLRNIQAVAEKSPSWLPVELFIRYQAARKEIYTEWAEEANKLLGSLRSEAQSIVGTSDPQLVGDVHMELVRRTLGYTVRWHVWDAKGATQREVKR